VLRSSLFTNNRLGKTFDHAHGMATQLEEQKPSRIPEDPEPTALQHEIHSPIDNVAW